MTVSVPYRVTSRLEERIVSCLPAATFELETLCRLAGIEESLDITTAAIECRRRPRLLVNPDFVEEYCARDEHLFLLVMHELWHVILAHTTLYPRVTPADNIAFDAVINSGLALQFPGPEYRGFLEAVNPVDAFPGCLLRPPEGWPRTRIDPTCGPPGTADIVRRLYPVPGEKGGKTPTYREILELLAAGGVEAENPAVVLLGDHGDAANDAPAMADEVFGEVVRRIVARWPPPSIPLGGRDAGGAKSNWDTAFATPSPDARTVFAGLLRRALGRHPGARLRRARTRIDQPGGLGVVPCRADRLRPTRVALGLPGVFWGQTTPTRARVPERPATAHVYLDVSGSMEGLLPYLCPLLAPYVAGGDALAFQFSTTVAALPAEALRRGKLTTTYGTDIRCVFDHILADPRVRQVLVVTDGYTGAPGAAQRKLVRERQLRVHVVLPAESHYQRDLKGIAASVTVLPPLTKERR